MFVNITCVFILGFKGVVIHLSGPVYFHFCFTCLSLFFFFCQDDFACQCNYIGIAFSKLLGDILLIFCGKKIVFWKYNFLQLWHFFNSIKAGFTELDGLIKNFIRSVKLAKWEKYRNKTRLKEKDLIRKVNWSPNRIEINC